MADTVTLITDKALNPDIAQAMSNAATAAGQARNEAEGFRNAAQGFRNEAEGFRNEAQTARTEAKDWATHTPGQPVEGSLESSRSYASRAQTSATQAQQAAQSAWQAPSVGIHGIPELARAAAYGMFAGETNLASNSWGGSLPGAGGSVSANSGASQNTDGSWTIQPDGQVGLNFQGPPSSDLSIGCVAFGSLESIAGAHMQIWRDGPGVVWEGWGQDLGHTGDISQRALVYEWPQGSVPGDEPISADWVIRIVNGGSVPMTITTPVLQPRAKLVIPASSGRRLPDLVRQMNGASHTITASDVGGVILLTRDGNQTIVLDGGLPVGYRLEVVCAGTGIKYIAPGAGQNMVLINKDNTAGEFSGIGAKATVIPLSSFSYLVSTSPALDQ